MNFMRFRIDAIRSLAVLYAFASRRHPVGKCGEAFAGIKILCVVSDGRLSVGCRAGFDDRQIDRRLVRILRRDFAVQPGGIEIVKAAEKEIE